MNSRTIMFIALIGAFGAIAFVVMAMMGVQKLTEKPLVRVAIEVSKQYKLREVRIALVPPTGSARTLRLTYETPVIMTKDSQREEMEAVAKSAWEMVKSAESNESLRLKREGLPVPEWGPFTTVHVRRTWRSEKGCFKRSEEASHEWTPPPPPPAPSKLR